MMCKAHGGTYKGNLPVILARPRSNGVNVAYVDACIRPIVQALNDAGLQTLNCCCGHGVRPGWIALEDGRQVLIAPDLETAQRMQDGFPAINERVSDETLKPCPFCGGDATLYQGREDYLGQRQHYSYVRCDSSDCGTQKAGLEEWNTRPVEDALRERVEALEAGLDKISSLAVASSMASDDAELMDILVRCHQMAELLLEGKSDEA